MRVNKLRLKRSGAVVVTVAACLIGLMGLVALAIDIGMVAVAKSQCQNAADGAAMVGVRTFNQQSGYNLTSVPKNAVMAAVANKLFNANFKGDPNNIQNPSADVYTSGDIKVECGGYYYIYNDSNASAEGFQIVIPGKSSTEPYTGVRATVTSTSPMFFGSVFGASPFNVKASAVAAHRPRDVVIVMDLSGSMNFQSRPGCYVSGGNYYPHWGPRNKSLNPESVFPKFGHYSDVTAAALQGTADGSTGDEWVTRSNVSSNWDPAGPCVIDAFMSSGSTRAWVRDSTKDSYATTPGGDNYLSVSGSYIKTVNEYYGGSPTSTQIATWERGGTTPSATSAGYGANFKGYTEGPGYWGKTFFIWPPDPRGSDLDPNDAANHANNGSKDWRQRFFFKKNTSTNQLSWLDHNNILLDPSGAPATSNNSGVTPIIKTPQTTTTVTENGVSVTYRYCINYAAIFHWLRNQDPKPFPSTMITGRIQYYTTIPDPTGDTNFNNRFWTQSPMTDLNERFWKDYVDFVLGLHETGANTYSNTDGENPWTSYIGNGDFYKWGSTAVQIKPRADGNYKGAVANKSWSNGSATIDINSVVNFSGSSVTPAVGDFVEFKYQSTTYKITAVSNQGSYYALTLDQPLANGVANGATATLYNTGTPRYMDYADNPYRPRHQFWFGAMTFVDWLGNYSVYHDGTNYTLRWPGNVHEAQAWTCKMGISASIDDIKNNHPNDFVGLTFFSSPNYSTSGGGQHNMAVIPLGRNYQGLKDSLWFPPSTVSGGKATITPYDADFNNVPRAKGGTSPGMSLMITYNLLSSSTTNLRNYATPSSTYRGYAGGLGRKGASRLVIFETDGAPNTRSIKSIVSSGANSYYPIRVKDPTTPAGSQTEFPSSGTYSDAEVFAIVTQICALDTASTPGYSTKRKPAQVYALGFGSLFEPSNSTTAKTDALNFLQSVQYYGNVATNTTGSNFPDWQRVYGDTSTRQQRLRDAITKIMQSGVQVSLIE